MRFSKRRAAAQVCAGALLVAAGVAFAGDAVPFPAEYRKWAVVRSLVVGPDSKSFAINGGFHHYYANEKALEGFRTGHFADGSVVVDERLEVRQEAGIAFEGPRKSLAVMDKESAQYQNTGGWGFDVFSGDDRTEGAPASVRAACFSCHSQRKERDLVFSEFRK
jgi:Cytochrome P460